MEYHLEYMPPEDLEQIYPKICRDFPPDECKKLTHLQTLMETGMEVGWYLVADGRRAGYAMIPVSYTHLDPPGADHGLRGLGE